MSESARGKIEEKFFHIVYNARSFFAAAKECIDTSISYGSDEFGAFWDQLSNDLQQKGEEIVNNISDLATDLALAIRMSPFLGEEDASQVKLALKAMRSAILLRRYRFYESEILHDEGMYIGVQPAQQVDSEPIPALIAERNFNDAAERVKTVTTFVTGNTDTDGLATEREKPSRYRPGTAFIMMWISPQVPELIDITECIKRCFRKFGITALKADDIEHNDIITARILKEIRSSEFLIADLTGERPSVYYEVGFAHAIDKRVILYRKAGTPIHFDLAAYNCPEYKNLKELEELLTKRLAALTGREPISS